MSLYHKYRPGSFEDMVGNKDSIASLRTVIGKDNPPHAFLFHGPTGCGKTTLGRIVAKELGCEGGDFREVDSADFRGIDTVREIRKQAHFKPLEGETKVWLVDEVHKMTNDAQNAFLKMLEDPPEHVFFILATTEPQKLIPTVRSRCFMVQLYPLNDIQMKKLLRRAVKAEGEILKRSVYDQIIQDSLGLPRNALQILDKVLGADPKTRMKVARQTGERQSQTIELCRALLQGEGWSRINKILSGLRDEDPETIRRAVMGYCNSVLLKSENIRAGEILAEMREPFYNTGFPGLTLACFTIVCGED